MKIVTKKAEDVFTALRGQAGSLGSRLLPVGEYDPDDPEDTRLQGLIPTFEKGYMFPAPVIYPLIITMSLRHHVLLHGATGVGKTMAVKMLASKCRLPITRINLDGCMERAEIIGYLGIPNPAIPDDDGYKTPALIRGIQRPGIVLIDEWDAARPEVSIAFQPLLEDANPGILLVEKDVFIKKHPDCVIMATANTRGLGDETGLYAGTSNQSYAQLNRFHMVVEVEPLKPENLNLVLKEQKFDGLTLEEGLRNQLVKFYESVLAAYKANTLTAPLSVRNMVCLALYQMLIGTRAIRLVVLDKLPTAQDRRVIEELAKRVNLME